MKLNKEQFMKTEVGSSMKECIKAWDKALGEHFIRYWETEEYKRAIQASLWCQAQWEVYQMMLRQFFGKEYCFSRTDEYFGICTDDEMDWLYKEFR